jgi:hypothetical protein
MLRHKCGRMLSGFGLKEIGLRILTSSAMTDPIATSAAATTDDGSDCGQPETDEGSSSSMSSSAAGEKRLTLLNGTVSSFISINPTLLGLFIYHFSFLFFSFLFFPRAWTGIALIVGLQVRKTSTTIPL